MKPRIFIGSSTESLNIAYAIQELLPDMEVTVWTQGIFQLSNNILDNLTAALDNIDFGVFVFSPDDLLVIREQRLSSARDNVVFELGLFIGRLGKHRSFFVIPKDRSDFHLPSDLLGINPATFDPNRQDKNLRAALGPACNQIRTAVEDALSHYELTWKLTPRLIYLLRHLEAESRARSVNHFGKSLAVFAEYGDGITKAYEQLSPEEKRGWMKASEYACRYLAEYKLARISFGSITTVRISEYGRVLLNSKTIQADFAQTFKQPLTGENG